MHGLGQRILVTAFEGWNDAGEAATSALDVVRAHGSYEQVWTVDPELYFDYQYTRPHIFVDDDGERRLRWPQATIWRPTQPDHADVWLLTGVEPARAWQGFVAEVLDVALREDITGFAALGSMMSDVPHTRPITIFASSENARIRSDLSLERSTYEGPVGILSALANAAEASGIPTVGLWASVPHYVAGHTPSPKAALALLDRFSELTGLDVPRGTLATDAARWEASIDAAAADDEEMAEYIRQLEQARDMWDSPEASGESIAREFEQYLRRDGDGPRRG